MDINFQFFKSIVEQDNSPIVICDISHIIIYMNPAAVKNYAKRGGEQLIGKSIFGCHNTNSCELIKKVTDRFMQSPEYNIVHTHYNPKLNKDIYMVALRDENGRLIGYYEKHECRERDSSPFYDLGDTNATK